MNTLQNSSLLSSVAFYARHSRGKLSDVFPFHDVASTTGCSCC